ncbi:hypothetical protein LTR93_011779 [Exophiala xenobiotica]|nr:hypothetical protein LTR93_011779 [Exophiala xenobiotica]
MEEMKGRALVSESSKTLFWDRVRTRNECKIIQDLTPLLVPSPEHLYASGHQDFEHIREELSVEWTRSKTLGGPRPKPDRAIGLGDLAFTEEEKAKLKNHTSFERATLFTDHLYFPFLLCEIKRGFEGLDRADRQNMHSASIAADAIVQLCRAGGTGVDTMLSGEILTFSISHNHETVKVYGHFPIIQGRDISFYRYHVTTFVLGLDEDGGWKRVYDFTLELCQTFYPHHINRIRRALAEMVGPPGMPSSSALDPVESESLGVSESAGSSQETNVFRVPLAPASRRQTEELAFLREQLARQEQQMAKQEQQYKEQIAKQEQRYKEQMAKQEQQHKEQMEMLQRLLDQQKA